MLSEASERERGKVARQCSKSCKLFSAFLPTPNQIAVCVLPRSVIDSHLVCLLFTDAQLKIFIFDLSICNAHESDARSLLRTAIEFETTFSFAPREHMNANLSEIKRFFFFRNSVKLQTLTPKRYSKWKNYYYFHSEVNLRNLVVTDLRATLFAVATTP